MITAMFKVLQNLIGNPVKFRDGPAAVIGDDRCNIATDWIR